jgi:hypothetical protein
VADSESDAGVSDERTPEARVADAAATPPVQLDASGCASVRTEVMQPPAALQETVAQIEGHYALTGRWSPASGSVQFTPSDMPFSGSIEIAQSDGTIRQVSGCKNEGFEVPISIALQTTDGALDERLNGTALLVDSQAMTVDGSPAPYVFQIQAALDLTQRKGSLQLTDDAYKTATLRATVTPFGTRGELSAGAEQRKAQEPLLSWPAAAEPLCGKDADKVTAFRTDSAHLRALHGAIDRVAAEHYEAHYEDGKTTTLSVQITPPTVACGTDKVLLPTAAHFETADGKLAVTVPVFLDTSTGRLHARSRTDVPWAFPPAELSEHELQVKADLASMAHAGIEAAFDEAPEVAGSIKVVGYGEGDCTDCSAECTACNSDHQQQVLTLTLGQ